MYVRGAVVCAGRQVSSCSPTLNARGEVLDDLARALLGIAFDGVGLDDVERDTRGRREREADVRRVPETVPVRADRREPASVAEERRRPVVHGDADKVGGQEER
jgi:hypothetical protein